MTSVTGTQDPTRTKAVPIADLKKKSAKAGKALTVSINGGLVTSGKCYGYNGATNPLEMSELDRGVLRLQSSGGLDSGMGIVVDQDITSYTHLEFKIRATITNISSSYTRLVVQIFQEENGGYVEMGLWRSPNGGSYGYDQPNIGAHGIVLNALYNPADVGTKEWITVRASLTGYSSSYSYSPNTKINSCSKIQFQVNGHATTDVQIKDLKFVSVISSSVPVSATELPDSSEPVKP